MNGPDHYREAERLLDEATSRGDFNPRAQWCLELAKLHTALAQVTATAEASDSREWVKAAFPVVRGSGGEGCQAGAVVVPAGAGLVASAPG